MQNSITKRSEDFSKWYLDVVECAELAEHSPVKGCMTIKPNGFAIWENMQAILDKMIKEKGVVNAYFPLFIPEEFLKREAEHVEGFSPELAVVTHAGGKKLDEPLVVRPTSETIMYEAYSRWISSYRDLPLLINQWANIVRWEMRTRLFLRTTEFLWQEGHTVHETPEEARNFVLDILTNVYKKFIEEYLAIPVLAGQKSENEKFAGALATFGVEAMMQDGKALQMGTSHDLSDHFAKVFNVTFLDREGKSQYAYQASWGVSTRMIGGLIMAHSDDTGLVLPPKIAPTQAVIVPISRDLDDEVMKEARKLKSALSANFKVKIDERLHLRPGEKYFDWEKKGVPIRIEIGPKELEIDSAILVRRDTGEKTTVKIENIEKEVSELLTEIQNGLFNRAQKFQQENTKEVSTYEEFKQQVEEGFALAYWCEDPECENQIKEDTKSTTRSLPLDAQEDQGEHKCIKCGKTAKHNKRWVFAKSY